jgi:mono/diheme cytochrome c family protein
VRLPVALALIVGLAVGTGCSDDLNSGPIPFTPNEQGAKLLGARPRTRAAIAKSLNDLFGASPRAMRVPKGAPLPYGGIYLANHVVPPGAGKVKPAPMKFHNSITDRDQLVEGGYALYRRHCLHCHGVSGDGNGPTAAFLWPRPRDFRKGIFKFTSSKAPNKPTREDLRRTLLQGVPNTAMPSFEALMTPQEIEQVLDFAIFLSMRGEAELSLDDQATLVEEAEADTYFTPEVKQGVVDTIFEAWRGADTDVLDPPVARVASTPESLARGRALFLGQTKEKLECAGCHGPKADGTGPSWIDAKTFDHLVFGSGIEESRFGELKTIAEAKQKKWGDEWGHPLRPSNLNQGAYKGGRRPIDIYWRIAKGINGTPMPAHLSTLKPEQIWDIVNFVLALPYQPELLRDRPASSEMARR